MSSHPLSGLRGSPALSWIVEPRRNEEMQVPSYSTMLVQERNGNNPTRQGGGGRGEGRKWERVENDAGSGAYIISKPFMDL